MNVDRHELSWAAGLFEGEGCITHAGHKGRVQPRLVLCTSDGDVLDRFYRAIGCRGTVRERREWAAKQAHHKIAHEWYVSRFEDVQHILCLLWTGLGARRRERARDILCAAVA